MSQRHKMEVETSVVNHFMVDRRGVVHDEESPAQLPCMTIEVEQTVLVETRKTLHYKSSAIFCGIDSKTEIAFECNEGLSYRDQSDAYEAAFAAGRHYICERIAEAIRQKSSLYLDDLDEFFRKFKDAGGEFAESLGREKTEFRYLNPDELLIARTVAFTHFRPIYENTNLLFRIRRDYDKEGLPKAWEAGRDANNRPVPKIGEVKRLSDEARHLYRAALGFGPHFLVTISAHEWIDANANGQREAIIHHLLCQCGWDTDKQAPFIVAPEIAAFASTAKAYGFMAVSPNVTLFVHQAVDAARQHQQLDMFGFDESGTEPAETAQATRRKAKAA